MMTSRIGQFILTTLVTAAGTWLLGWWAVPVVAIVAGAGRIRPGFVAGACALAWGLLLIGDAVQGPITRMTSMMGGVMGLPGVALIVLTIAFPAILGWSAATIGTTLSSIRPVDESVRHVS